MMLVCRAGWVVWIVVGFMVALVGGAAAWVDLDLADKVSSVVGAVCCTLGLALLANTRLERGAHRPGPAARRTQGLAPLLSTTRSLPKTTGPPPTP